MMYRALALLGLVLLPLVSSAQTFNLSPLASLIGALSKVVGTAIPILITLALATFFWGLVKYLWNNNGKAALDDAKKLMRWGLVILFVMVSVWGIIELAQSALAIDPNARGHAPQIEYNGSSGGSFYSTNCKGDAPGC